MVLLRYGNWQVNLFYQEKAVEMEGFIGSLFLIISLSLVGPLFNYPSSFSFTVGSRMSPRLHHGVS